jgi:PPOX class probable F420-dependent enzyme
VTATEARERFAAARVARLATASADARPHLVPMVFAVVGETIYSAVDHKPKRTTALRRLENVIVNPAVALLVDAYDEDWSQLWWVRAEGRGRVLDRNAAGAAQEVDVAVRALVARYAPYVERPPAGPVLAVDVERWAGWSWASG